jgi:hypothetical protein
MKDSPKESGKSKLKRWLNKSSKDKRIKHITLAIKQAQEIMEEIKTDGDKPDWSLKSNSLKAGAIVLCIDPKELLERLESDKPSKLRNDIAEARNKIKSLEEIGDMMFDALSLKEQELIANKWVMTKKLYR